jgi:tRNA 2-thiouridine synthesizing protein E
MMKTNHWLTYEHPRIPGAQYRTDSAGFLCDFEDWTEDFAHLAVSQWGMPEGLTDRHRQVIVYLRGSYSMGRETPTVFEACKANDLSLKELKALFPEGYRRGACRVAGLPFLP